MTEIAPLLPEYATSEELAAHFGTSDRWVRSKAREIGACCIMGKKMIHLRHHVEMLLEELQPCQLNSTSAA